MNPFLKTVAENLYAEHGNELEEVMIVLPSKRAGLFLKRFLGEHIKKPFFSPKITVIQDFVSELSSLQIEEPVYLLFDLYEIHKEIEGLDALGFSEFFSFGEMMIHDFSEIDLAMADAKAVFSWLSSEKALSMWNLDGSPLTDFQKQYLRFYNSLWDYYTHFSQHLLQKKKTYEGMAFRILAEQIQSIADTLPYKQIWFCGFNALSKSEKTFFRYLERTGKAHLVWDTDAYYMQNDVQEAGLFLREYASYFSSLSGEAPEHFKTPKQIHIISTPENVLQAKVAGQLLDEFSRQDTLMQSTALVLADENLLTPMLNSIPASIEQVNVTMGYSFLQTPLHDLIYHIFQYHLQVSKQKERNSHYQIIEKMLQNTLIRQTLAIQTDYLFRQKIEELGKTYLSVFDIEWICASLFIDYEQIDFLFAPLAEPASIMKVLNRLFHLFIESEIEHALFQEYVLSLHGLLVCFHHIPQTVMESSDLKSMLQIYLSFARKNKIPFFGEPLKGLQMMGMLETRCLDFERVILLSANEGVLPAGRQSNSLIPFQLKKQFDIPTYQDRDAIFAYHFYRLLQQSKEIYLVYNTDSDGMLKGEKSRFIKQIQLELPLYNPQITISETPYKASAGIDTGNKPIQIKKDVKTMALLKKRALFPGFSPSALNTYSICSLRFYYLYILRIKEEKRLTDEITPDIYGSVCHSVLEQAFTQKEQDKTNFDPSRLEEVIANLEAVFIKTLKRYFKSEIRFGKNKLFVSVAISQLETFLKSQLVFLKNHHLQIMSLERRVEYTHWFSVKDTRIPVKFMGIVDRIDCVDHQLRIVDYKTGKVNPSDVKMQLKEIGPELEWKEKWFQLMMYAWLLSHDAKYNLPYISGIYSLRQTNGAFIPALLDGNELITQSAVDYFESILFTIVSSIFDTHVVFSQTDKKEHCSYCQFSALCGR